MGNGVELLTIFVTQSTEPSAYHGEVPVLSVLQDTLGDDDPQTTRLRDVWLLTAGRPSTFRRIESALPFLYLLHTPEPSRSPQPVHLMDFGTPVRQTESALLSALIQGQMLDPAGRALRTTTRSYRMNDSDDRAARAAQAVAALADAERNPDIPAGTVDDLERLHARLLLSNSMLGGLVRDQRLLSYHDDEETQREMSRGHNWDLLRQTAEANHLYFEPLSSDGLQPDYAILWVRRADLPGSSEPFDGKLLHIANPFRNGRVARWHGYSEQWYFDANGQHLDEPDSDAVRDEVIPLALYSLEHPRVPLLLVDFQNGGAPRRREDVGQAAEEVTRGLLGLSPIAHWNYFIARSMVQFVRNRHGAAGDKAARIRAWAELSYALSTSVQIRPGLRDALQHNVHAPVFDTDDERINSEATLAWQRYHLLTGADSPVPEIAERRRRSELAAMQHGRPMRFVLSAARMGTLGRYEHQSADEDIRAELEWSRRLQWNAAFLESVAHSTPQIEVAWDTERVRRSVDEITRLAETRPISHDTVSPALARVAMNTQDDDLRHRCLRALGSAGTAEARRQLAVLSRSGSFDCPICRQYLAHRDPPEHPSASLAGAQ